MLSSLGIVAGVVLAMAGVSHVFGRPAPARPVPGQRFATLLRLTGPVHVATRGSATHEMQTGERVTAGAAIESGAGGRAVLQLDAGPTIRLDVDTRIVMDSPARLTLEHGALYVDSQSQPNRARLHIQTTHGIVRDLGTQFEVRVEHASLRIRVRDGEAQLEPNDDGREEPVAAAARLVQMPLLVLPTEELHVAAGGDVEQRLVATDDEGWSWIDTITPP